MLSNKVGRFLRPFLVISSHIMITGSEDEKQIKSLHTAFDIIESIEKYDGGTLAELSDRLEYSKSTIHYYLRTLESRRYVIKEEGAYRLGLRFLDLGGHALSWRDPPSLIKREIDALAEETGWTSLFAVEEEGKSVYVYEASPDDEHLEGFRLGTERHLHCTAFGRVILAHLPEDYRSNIIEYYGLPAVTDATVTDQEALDIELQEIRERDFAFEDEEHLRGVRTIAAPVEDDANGVFGAVGLAGKVDELDDLPKHAKAQRFTDNPSNRVKRIAQAIRSKLQDERP